MQRRSRSRSREREFERKEGKRRQQLLDYSDLDGPCVEHTNATAAGYQNDPYADVGWAPAEFKEGDKDAEFEAEAAPSPAAPEKNEKARSPAVDPEREEGEIERAEDGELTSTSAYEPVYDESTGYFFYPMQGLYFDPATNYFFSAESGQWLYYAEETQSYHPVETSTADPDPPEKKDRRTVIASAPQYDGLQLLQYTKQMEAATAAGAAGPGSAGEAKKKVTTIGPQPRPGAKPVPTPAQRNQSNSHIKAAAAAEGIVVRSKVYS